MHAEKSQIGHVMHDPRKPIIFSQTPLLTDAFFFRSYRNVNGLPPRKLQMYNTQSCRKDPATEPSVREQRYATSGLRGLSRELDNKLS